MNPRGAPAPAEGQGKAGGAGRVKSIPWARLHPSPAPSQLRHPPELQPGAGSAPSPLRPPREQQPDPAPAIPADSQRVPLPPVLGIPAAEANGAVSAGLALPVFLPRALPWLLAIPNARDNLLMHGWCGWSRIMGASSPRRSRGGFGSAGAPGMEARPGTRLWNWVIPASPRSGGTAGPRGGGDGCGTPPGRLRIPAARSPAAAFPLCCPWIVWFFPLSWCRRSWRGWRGAGNKKKGKKKRRRNGKSEQLGLNTRRVKGQGQREGRRAAVQNYPWGICREGQKTRTAGN